MTPSNLRIPQQVRQHTIDRIFGPDDIPTYLDKLRQGCRRKMPYRLLYIVGVIITKMIAIKNRILQLPHLKDLKAAAVRNSSIDGHPTRPLYVVVPKNFPDIVDLQTYYNDGDHFPPGRCPNDEHWALATGFQERGEPGAFLTACGATPKSALRSYRKHGIEFRLPD
jgi:hypothetical protein